MRFDWKGIAIIAGAILTVYFISRRDAQNLFSTTGTALTDAIQRGLTGDAWRQVIADSNYQPVEITPQSQLDAQHWIDLGYAYYDSSGVFRITPAGEAYIRAQGGQ